MDDESFRQILQFFSLSWAGYRKVRKAVKKRLVRHMVECRCRKVEDYLLFLKNDPVAIQEARKLLTVSISRFFRDRHLWDGLGQHVIPKLMREAESAGPWTVRVWSAGCSCGEEVYSWRILWERTRTGSSVISPMEVWATDANPEVLEKARMGVYPRSSVKGLPSRLMQDYLVPVLNGFAIRDALKDGIHWMKHDFVCELPPGIAFDLIFLRNNLLTYYEETVKQRAFLQVLTALRAGGFIVLGNNEQIPTEDVPLRRCSECRCIFEKESERGTDGTGNSGLSHRESLSGSG